MHWVLMLDSTAGMTTQSKAEQCSDDISSSLLHACRLTGSMGMLGAPAPVLPSCDEAGTALAVMEALHGLMAL